MGKSPAKWIRTLLFGKKSSRSHASKGRASAANNKDWSGGKGGSALTVGSPVISEPIPVSNSTNGVNPELEKEPPSSITSGGEVVLPEHQKPENQGSSVSRASNDPDKVREEQAAIKTQAAFRGYLARRAFRALKGIIRLQALIRGHLVRRQAGATLRCMQGIVKFQALVRGRRVRLSDIGFEVKTQFCQEKEPKRLDSFGPNISAQKVKLSANAFVCKLLSSSTVTKPLQIQYGEGESNSAWNWLERWTSSSLFWKPLPRPKKKVDSKSQGRHGRYAMETESGRPKRSVRRNFSANVESEFTNAISEPGEKHKRNLRKVSSHPADSMQENPQSELEKVKRNLRKVSNSVAEASDQVEVETEKPKRSVQKVVSNSPSDVPNQGTMGFAEKMKNDIITLAPEMTKNVATTSMPVLTDGPVNAVHEDQPVVELHPSQDVGKDENLTVINVGSSSKEEQACHENPKTSKRRASFSAKSELTENGLQTSPTVPSYMAATESAKAKLRGQNSPRLGSDGIDKNGFTRRHSLPSSTNGKLTSTSPRTQRLVQASGKGGIRSDRSLSSSRDGNEKPIQVEWRR